MIIVLKAIDISFEYFYFYTGQKGERRKYFFCILQEFRLMRNSLRGHSRIKHPSRVIASNWCGIVYVPYSFLNTTIPVSVFLALYFALVPLYNRKTLGSALLKFEVEFKDNKAIRTVLRGILITAYFHWIPLGLLTLMDVFNFEAETPEFLVLFAGTLLLFVLYFFIILIVTLFNRRFLFDRLTGAKYDSTVKK